jgi:hypothetical protein
VVDRRLDEAPAAAIGVEFGRQLDVVEPIVRQARVDERVEPLFARHGAIDAIDDAEQGGEGRVLRHFLAARQRRLHVDARLAAGVDAQLGGEVERHVRREHHAHVLDLAALLLDGLRRIVRVGLLPPDALAGEAARPQSFEGRDQAAALLVPERSARRRRRRPQQACIEFAQLPPEPVEAGEHVRPRHGEHVADAAAVVGQRRLTQGREHTRTGLAGAMREHGRAGRGELARQLPRQHARTQHRGRHRQQVAHGALGAQRAVAVVVDLAGVLRQATRPADRPVHRRADRVAQAEARVQQRQLGGRFVDGQQRAGAVEDGAAARQHRVEGPAVLGAAARPRGVVGDHHRPQVRADGDEPRREDRRERADARARRRGVRALAHATSTKPRHGGTRRATASSGGARTAVHSTTRPSA